MTFPFSVTFNKRLKSTITVDNQQTILQCIMKSILDDKANNVVIENMHVVYKGSTSTWIRSVFGSVDDGIFTLIYKDNAWWLNYQINMRKLFIGAAVLASISSVFELVSGGFSWVDIATYLCLLGFIWIFNLIGHETVAANIAAGIDELICGKTELPEEDKMTGKLKSWF